MARSKRVLITMEQAGRFFDIFQPDIMEDLEREAEVVLNDLGRAFTPDELLERARDMDALITSWGTPRIDVRVADESPRLSIICHAAGSVKSIYDPLLWDRGIVITSAAAAMARYVGEFCLCAALAMLRSLPKYAPGASAEQWDGLACDGWETLVGKRVGLIGLGQTARAFLRCLEPFDCETVACDPYCSREKAAAVGVRLVSLEELLSTAKVISLHAAVTSETVGMLNAGNLSLVPDGTAFINSARGALVDAGALTAQLATGRFKAVLDVTDPEPLPADHELRAMPNVVVTPHTAGPTPDGRRDMFRSVVDDLKVHWAGGIPANVVTRQMLATMA